MSRVAAESLMPDGQLSVQISTSPYHPPPRSFSRTFLVFLGWVRQLNTLIAVFQHSVYFEGICGEEVFNGTRLFLTMKHAQINPVHKSGPFSSAENYKLISILPIFCKLFEKLINKQIMSYLETDK